MKERLVGLGRYTLLAGAIAAIGCGAHEEAAPAATPPAQQASAAATAAPAKQYIVKLAEAPLALYAGGVDGLAPTNPRARGEVKLDAESADSQAYLAYLDGRHERFRSALSATLGRDAQPLFRYRYAFNGMAVELDAAEVATVKRLPGVKWVQEAQEREIQTDVGPQWINADDVWTGATGLPGNMGEGIVVGIIDTGINFDHPSFADTGGDGYNHENPRGRRYGLCGLIPPLPVCNDKLIGVHTFAGPLWEDDHGHGSHTASTTAGNVVDATVKAPTSNMEFKISGVAPHANIISYKGCLVIGSCLSPSLVAAIDQATADGVDVINYSIGGSSTLPWGDADAEAFLGAREAGIFAAVSAGNSGPAGQTIGSPSNAPWVLSVGASTHSRKLVNSLVELAGGVNPPADIEGVGLTAGYGPAKIVHASQYGDPLCGMPFLPGTFDGEIVICDRGINPRVEKGRNVKIGGAGGMVLANDKASGESVVADAHELPALHVGFAAGQRLSSWVLADDGDKTGRITGTEVRKAVANGDVMASFSSRGPESSVPSIMKPDVTAPGVAILAAMNTNLVLPTLSPEYGIMSGTSMSSPHAAGAAALVRKARPDWTAAEIHSALVTTGVHAGVRNDDGAAAGPFDFGGGRIDVAAAVKAGLVLDETPEKFIAADPREGGDPTTLNLPSMTQDRCVGRCSWTRTVKSTVDGTVTWTVSKEERNGVRIDVEPSVLTLTKGQTANVTITADVLGIDPGKWVFGAVTFKPAKPGVSPTRLPLAALAGGSLQLVVFETGNNTDFGTTQITTPVAFGRISAEINGLVLATLTEELLPQDPTPLDPWDDVLGGYFEVTHDVPAGSRIIRAEILDSDSLDLDLFMGADTNGDGTLDESEVVCSSATGAVLEACQLENPLAGTWIIRVQNWLGTAVSDVKLESFVVPPEDKNNLEVTGPYAVRANTTFDATIAWNEPTMKEGDHWYAVAELADVPDGLPKVGRLLVKIIRIADDGQPPQFPPDAGPYPDGDGGFGDGDGGLGDGDGGSGGRQLQGGGGCAVATGTGASGAGWLAIAALGALVLVRRRARR